MPEGPRRPRRPARERERIAREIYERIHPAMALLGLLFAAVTFSYAIVPESTPARLGFAVATWILWALFLAEFLVRLAISPSTVNFLRKNWWQIVFLVLPFLSIVRALLILRLARSGRLLSAAVRGARSARASLASRTAWLAVVSILVILTGTDLTFEFRCFSSYASALHDVALAAMVGEPMSSHCGLSAVLEVVLGAFSVIVFATLAGTVGAFLLQHHQERPGERLDEQSV